MGKRSSNAVKSLKAAISSVHERLSEAESWAELEHGGHAIIWQDFCLGRNGYVVRLQCLNPRGAPVGATVDVTSVAFPAALLIAVAPVDDGGFFVYWQQHSAAHGEGFGQRFDADGSKRGALCRF